MPDYKHYDVKAALNLGFGMNGATVETGTTAITGGNFIAIQVIEDAVFSTLTMTDYDGDALTSVTFPAGFVIYGRCTAFTLTSGKVIAYKGTPRPT